MTSQNRVPQSFTATCWRDAEQHLGLQVLSGDYESLHQRRLVVVTERGRELLQDHLGVRKLELFASDIANTAWHEEAVGQLMLRHEDLFPLLATYASLKEYAGFIVKKDSRTTTYNLVYKAEYFANYLEMSKGKEGYTVFERIQGTRRFKDVTQ